MNLSKYTLPQLAEMSLQKPEDFGYWGSEDMFITWGFTGHDRNGMSKILEEANFKAISEDLISKYPNDFRIEHYRHWLCGWVDRLVCRVLIDEKKGFSEQNITEAFAKAVEYHQTLNDYPIFDEDLYYDMQAEATYDSIKDLPSYMLNMIDQNDPDWVTKIIECLDQELNVYIDPDAELYAKDDDILLAVYIKELWNPEEIELWEDFCSRNNLQYPPKKKNHNQLHLFGHKHE